MTDDIEARNPEAALGWVTAQYEELVTVCEAPRSRALV
jgi:membrane protein required for colicin V production